MESALETLVQAVKSRNTEQALEQARNRPELLTQTDEHGTTPLLTAIYYGARDIAEGFIALHPSPTLQESAAAGLTGHVFRLLEGVGSTDTVRAYSGDGFTALHLAVFLRHNNIVKQLIAAGADVNAVARNGMKVAPLHSAVAARNHEGAILLLQAGADPNSRQHGGWTPLIGAAHNGMSETVALLLRAGADPSAANDEGITPLAMAEKEGHTEAAALLRSAGAIGA